MGGISLRRSLSRVEEVELEDDRRELVEERAEWLLAGSFFRRGFSSSLLTTTCSSSASADKVRNCSKTSSKSPQLLLRSMGLSV